MDNNTHEEFIVFKDGTTAFITGVPDECDHKWNGDVVLESKSGGIITWSTYPKWAGYTSWFREKLIYEHHEKICDPIVSSSVTCSKCKKMFVPSMYESLR